MCAEPFGTISRHTDRHTAWNRWAASCYYYCGRGFCACAVPQGFPYSRSVVYTCSRPNSFLIQQRTPDNRINNPVAYDTCLALYVHIYVSSIYIMRIWVFVCFPILRRSLSTQNEKSSLLPHHYYPQGYWTHAIYATQ